MVAADAPRRRLRGALELVVVATVVLLLSLHALWRMDYLNPATANHVRLTDSSRSALVARNLVEGNGYTTLDLPAALLDLYTERGKLDDARWVNADRFPFTAFAVAALYTVTGSTSPLVGILLYNLLCFVALFTLLYHFGRRLYGRSAAVLALALALLHPYTYVFLYAKDADTLLLTTACLLGFHRYAGLPRDGMSWRFALGFGTLLAWTFLARPNLGLAFIGAFGVLMVHRAWTGRRAGGVGAAIARMARRELLVAVAVIAWCAPLVVHSLREWGSPLFSGNSLYQLPLGTRFGMGTDTWWKYTDPAQSLGLAQILDGAGDEMWRKFWSSWIFTTEQVLRAYAFELALAFGVLAWGRRRAAAAPTADVAVTPPPSMRLLWTVIGFAVVSNLALLPAYGYQNYGYQHYLAFVLPLLWVTAGGALVVLAASARPAVERVGAHLRTHGAAWVIVIIAGLALWSAGARVSESSSLVGRLAQVIAAAWWAFALGLLALLRPAWVFRRPVLPRLAVAASVLVFAAYRPLVDFKRQQLMWMPSDPALYDALRERHGLVSSFAVQGDVAWTTHRRNIPVPEYAMHLYSYAFDHGLVVEDVYLESAAALMSLDGGPFRLAAPGFEQYERLQRLGAPLPGYERVFHHAEAVGYPKYGIKPRGKASTVYRQTDPDAVRAMAASPTRLPIGELAGFVYTAHGFDGYYRIDGRPVVAATDVTRNRYSRGHAQPWEDTSVTFFLDERRPDRVTLEFYTVAPATYDFYWNLDLYAYDRRGDRPAHLIGQYAATQPGWHKAELTVPRELTRAGLNKLGFRASSRAPLLTCPADLDDGACLGLRPYDESVGAAVRPFRAEGIDSVRALRVAMFAAALDFHYAP